MVQSRQIRNPQGRFMKYEIIRTEKRTTDQQSKRHKKKHWRDEEE